jgi:ACS family tartrate transporter-like MFS transporter
MRRRLRNKLLLRLVAPLTLLIFLNALDRVNVSFAALKMNAALGLRPEQFGFGAGLFFVGYLLCQFPHTALLRRIGTRRWIIVAMLASGASAAALACVQTAWQFYALRVLLGAAEAGLAPGVVYITSRFMPRRFRAQAVAGSMLAIPASVVLGGPLSGLLLSVELHPALPGWRALFLIEGVVTAVVGLLTGLAFPETPEQARWLDPEERAWLIGELERDGTPDEPDTSSSLRDVLRSGRVWTAAGVWFALMASAYGIIYWLPQVIKQLSGRSDLAVSLLSALPWIGLGAGMSVVAWHSDRTAERYGHVALPSLLAAAGLVLGAQLGSPALALASQCVGAFGLGGAQGTFWTLPTGFLPRTVAASGITLINLIGNVAGLVTPPAIGWLRARGGSFGVAACALAALLAGAALLTFALRRHQRQDGHAVAAAS